MAGDSDAPWRCVIESRSAVGSGRDRHVRYVGQLTGGGQPPRPVQFRFKEIDALRVQLARVPELQDVTLPALPPKVTMRSLLQGRFDESFQAERQTFVHRFLEDLLTAISAKYAEAGGDVTELCEPLGHFLEVASQRGVAAEVAAVASAVRAAEVAEDREIIDLQNVEYEESLRRDREVQEQALVAAEAAAAAVAEERRRKAEEEQKVLALEADRLKRRHVFEAAHQAPSGLDPKATIKFRKPDGESLTRAFRADAPVEALFEFVFVAQWKSAPPAELDLKTAIPVRSLQAEKSKTLQEAGLCPSAALVIVVEDD